MKTNADKQFDNFLNRQIENSKNQMDDAAAKLLKSYNHEMFIDAINNKKIKIEVVNQKQFARQCFNSLGSNISLVMLIFSILPYIFIPLICYKYNKWILLVGILGLILGQILAYVFRVLVLRLSITIEFALSFYIVTAIVCYYLSVLHTFSFVLVCILDDLSTFDTEGKDTKILLRNGRTEILDIHIDEFASKVFSDESNNDYQLVEIDSPHPIITMKDVAIS